MAALTHLSRCSIASVSRDRELVIRAGSDMPAGEELRLDLDKYPEVKKSIENNEFTIINDVKSDPILSPVRKELESAGFNSVLVVPISNEDSVVGTFLLRSASSMKNGISERTLKLCQLVANISYSALENATLFESMKTAQDFLEEMAITDGLTSLHNHRYFYERLESEFSRAKRYKSSLSCIFIDIDDFKNLNDTYGHKVGDEVLKKIGSLIKGVVRESDIAARYGGEEFAILLPQTEGKGAMDMAGRLHEAVRECAFQHLVEGSVTISLGVSTFRGDGGKSPDHLVQMADKAMYKAKSLGKDRVFQLK